MRNLLFQQQQNIFNQIDPNGGFEIKFKHWIEETAFLFYRKNVFVCKRFASKYHRIVGIYNKRCAEAFSFRRLCHYRFNRTTVDIINRCPSNFYNKCFCIDRFNSKTLILNWTLFVFRWQYIFKSKFKWRLNTKKKTAKEKQINADKNKIYGTLVIKWNYEPFKIKNTRLIGVANFVQKVANYVHKNSWNNNNCDPIQ